MDILNGYIDLQVAGFCLLFGNVLKNNLSFVKNDYIPLILGALGIVLNVGFKGCFSFECILSGFVSGLFSTSIHQIYKGVKGDTLNLFNKN